MNSATWSPRAIALSPQAGASSIDMGVSKRGGGRPAVAVLTNSALKIQFAVAGTLRLFPCCPTAGYGHCKGGGRIRHPIIRVFRFSIVILK